MTNSKNNSGFTLIELSIVLVIIGLIVGGVLVGQDLIEAARIRAQISQIESYQTATRTFQVKYGYLPGDIPDPYATQFGFIARGQYPGEGDGNGVLQSRAGNSNGIANPFLQDIGETLVFWVDLSKAQLIDGAFTSASSTTKYKNGNITSAFIKDVLPQAKIGQNGFIYVDSSDWNSSNNNYFNIAAFNYIGDSTNVNQSLIVLQAYNIDKKLMMDYHNQEMSKRFG